MLKCFKIFVSTIFAISVIVSCSKDDSEVVPIPTNAYSTLAKHPDLSITLQAIDMAGLQNELEQDNLTFFAPTDSAFTEYLHGLGVDSILGLYNFYGANTFRNFLQYHLLGKKLKAMDVVNSYVKTAATSSNGNCIHAYISSIDKNIYLNAFTATVSEADIAAGTSIIHKVDGVLTPLTLNGLIRVNPNFSKLKSAISKSQDNLETILNQENQIHTIFGPDDMAMTTFLSSNGFASWSDYTNASSNYALSSLLKYHILRGETQAQDLQSGTYHTLYTNHWVEILKNQSGTINIEDENGSTPMAMVKTTDINAINGVIHVISKVLEHN